MALVASLLMLLCLAWDANAHSSQKEHDDALRDVLFGEEYALTGAAKARFQAIADAASLCIDQFSANEHERRKERLFHALNERVGFSFSFDDIELKKDGMKTVTAKTHRRYTHRGWNFQEYPLPKLWGQRKKILTATVNRELFGKSAGWLSKLPFAEGSLYSEAACHPQCEAFCQMVYDIHILGDYEAAQSYSAEFQQLIPLARHEDPSSPALIQDIISAARVLFADQRWRLDLFVQELEAVEDRAERLLANQGGIRTQEQFDAYHVCGEEVYKILLDLLPGMLRKVDFFSNAFF